MNKLVFLVPIIAGLLVATTVIAKKDGGNPVWNEIQKIWNAINSLNSTVQGLNTRIEQLEQCACAPCTDIEEICDDGIDNDCDGLTDGDDLDCVPLPCNYCIDGQGGDTSLMCELVDNDWKNGSAQSDYEWYWFTCEPLAIAHLVIQDLNQGDYELCGAEPQQPRQCPTSDPGWDCKIEGEDLIITVSEVESYWVLAHRVSGPAGFKIHLYCDFIG